MVPAVEADKAENGGLADQQQFALLKLHSIFHCLKEPRLATICGVKSATEEIATGIAPERSLGSNLS